MIQDPLFYAAAIPSVLLLGISKSGFGGSLGILAIPLLAMVVSPSAAAAIMLPLLMVMDVLGMFTFRGKAHPPSLKILIPAAVAGIAIGAFTFRYTSDAMLRGMIGALAVGFVFQRMAAGSAAPASGISVVKGSVWGAVSGFTSFIANAGGPPFVIYMAPQRLDKVLFAGTSVIFFAVINFVKVFPFVWLGLFDTRNLTTSLVLVPFAPLGYWIGLKLLAKVDQDLFYKIITVALFVSGCKLLWDASVLFRA